MKKALLNQLRIERLEKCTIGQRGEICRKLLDGYGFTNRSLGEALGIPHSTIHDWATGRQEHRAGSLHISIDRIINHFKLYELKEDEKDKVKELIKVLEQLL